MWCFLDVQAVGRAEGAGCSSKSVRSEARALRDWCPRVQEPVRARRRKENTMPEELNLSLDLGD